MKVIYIAGPITKGDPVWNAAQADRAAFELMERGFAVINPMLTMWAGAAEAGGTRPDPKAHGPFETLTHETWVKTSLALVERCDAVLRLPGDSRGADAEVAHADLKGIPVYYSVEDVTCRAD